MIYRNLDDVERQLVAFGLDLTSGRRGQGGLAAGAVYVETAASVKCNMVGARKKSTGWYWLHEFRMDDGIYLVGSYGEFSGPDANPIKIDLTKTCDDCGAQIGLKDKACPACGSKKATRHTLTAEQIEAHKKRMAENRKRVQAERQAAADRAAGWAEAVWMASRDVVAVSEHDYLTRKHLSGAHGARLFGGVKGVKLDGASDDETKRAYEYLARFVGALVVPMCNLKGRVRGIQFILSREVHAEFLAERAKREKGDKEYWPAGMVNDGLFHLIGGSMRDVGLVAEGFATAASAYEASGLPTAVAFDAGGLQRVGEALRGGRKQRLRLLYLADDDWIQRCAACAKYTTVRGDRCDHCGEPHRKANAGVVRASEAALATDGAWLAPVFAGERPRTRKGPTDFNDLRSLEGEAPVRVQIETKLQALSWRVAGVGELPPVPPSGENSLAGGGGGEPRRSEAVSVMSLNAVVERFIYVDDDTGNFVFDTWTHNVCKRDKIGALLEPGVRGDDVKDHPRWRQRAIYIDQIGFDPGYEDPNIRCNRWRGWPTQPRHGKCELLLELLRYQCNNEPALADALYQWVLRWLAYPLAHPGAKMQTAIIMHGPQGAGKGRFFETYAKIFGDYGILLNQGAIEDKFNSDWSERKLFILADEIVARQDMYHIKNQLKGFVTGDWVRVNPKNVAAHRERNHMNIVFLSNEKQPLILENDDRRYCVIWTPPPLPADFYVELSDEINTGGVAALHQYLLDLDLGDFKPWTKPPMTDAKRELIDLGRESVDRFINDWRIGDIDGLPFCPCASSDLYRAYLDYCRANGERNPRPENHFSGHIIKMPGWIKGHRDIRFRDAMHIETARRQRVVIPSAEDLSAAVRLGLDDARQPPQQLQVEWLSAWFHRFREAIRRGDGGS